MTTPQDRALATSIFILGTAEDLIRELLGTAELNQDDLEDATRETIQKARDFLGGDEPDGIDSPLFPACS